MPKYTPYSITALNEVTGRRERITISAEALSQYSHIGRPRKIIKPASVPLIKRLDPEYTAAMDAEYEQHIADKRLLASLLHKRRLIDRIDKDAEKHSLLDRLTPPSTPYELPKPVPKTIKFRKTHLMKRQSEFKNVLTPTLQRVLSIYKKLEGKEKEEKEYHKVKELLSFLEQIATMFETNETDKWTSKDWRLFQRDCKKIKHINFKKDLEYRIKSLASVYDSGVFKNFLDN